MKNELLIEQLKIAIQYWSKKLNENDNARTEYQVLLKFEELLKGGQFNPEDFAIELVDSDEAEANARLRKFGYTDPLNEFEIITKRCKIVDFISPGIFVISSIDDQSSKAMSYKRLWLNLSISTLKDENLKCRISDYLCPFRNYQTYIKNMCDDEKILDVRPGVLVVKYNIKDSVSSHSLIESVVVHSVRGNRIDEGQFQGASNMTSISFDDQANIHFINQCAFSFCTSLSSIEIPEGVKYICFGAFGWSGISSIKLPNSLTSLENNVFENCENLKELTLPAGIRFIFIGAFENSHIQHIIVNLDPEVAKRQNENTQQYYGFGYANELTTLTFTSKNLDESTIDKIEIYNCKKLTTIEVASQEIKDLFQKHLEKCQNKSKLNPNLRIVVKN